MLAQLICMDRRYQRMNSFNAREFQALLKQRFFSELRFPYAVHAEHTDAKAALRYVLHGTGAAERAAPALGIVAPHATAAPARAQMHDMTIFKYDYKAGHYLPAEWLQL